MDKFIDRTNGNILFVETTTEVSKHANGDMLETNIRLRERMTNDCLGYAQFVCSLLDMSHPAGISMFATVNMRPFNEPQEETLSDFIAQAAFFENKTYLPIKSKIDGL